MVCNALVAGGRLLQAEQQAMRQFPSSLYSCPILINLKFSRQIIENSSSTKFHENPSSGSRVVPYGRMDGQT